MAFQLLGGFNNVYPRLILTGTSGSSSIGVIDATGEKLAMCGPVWFPARTGTKDIRKVHWRWGAIVKTGGSALTFSLQDISNSAQAQPDEVQDQTYAIANADAGFVSSTWYTTGNLSSDRTVTYGQMLCCVWEFDGAGRLGSDSVVIALVQSGAGVNYSYPTLKSGGTWATLGAGVNVLFEFSDGTFGTLHSSQCPELSYATTNFNSSSTPDEYALEFTTVAPIQIDSLAASVTQSAADRDFDLVLYSGTTPLATASFDGTHNGIINAGFVQCVKPIALTTLVSGTYRLAVKPTTTGNIAVQIWTMQSNSHFSVYPPPNVAGVVTRTDGGAWSAPTATNYISLGMGLAGIDDGVQLGGLLDYPGLNGGLIG